MTKNLKKALSVLLALSMLLMAFTMAGCKAKTKSGKEAIKIGVLREDDTSGEATAWEDYLSAMGKDLDFTVEFVTTDSSSAEVSAINTFASKGYKAILLFSDDDVIASVKAASDNEMYVVCPTGHPTDEQYEQLKDNKYYLGSAAPTEENDYDAGYNMAKFFVEEKGQNTFTVFGGATAYGSSMHISRLSGMLAYLCETGNGTYDGTSDPKQFPAKVAGTSLDTAKFVSDKYKITGYMDGFAFDDAFSTKLTNSLESGGTCVLSVGAGDTIAKIAYGITSSNSKIKDVMVGGVDAITPDYSECFDLGYTYDCGKFASAMAPGLILVLSAVREDKIVNGDGNAPKIGMNYWVATSKDELETMLKADNKTDGYCYNSKVIEHFVGGSYNDLVELCENDYDGAVKTRDEYSK